MADTPTPQLDFAGFTSPTYTQVPDELFDVLMPQLSDAELRVLLYIVRRTFGFKRDSDSISLSQMVKGITTHDGRVLDTGTGLAKSTVARGLKGLRDKGIIVATRNQSKTRGDQPTTYRLRFKADIISEPPAAPAVSQQQDTPRVSPTGQAVTQAWDTQQTAQQETPFESSNEKTLGWDYSEQGREVDQTVSHPDRTASSFSEGSLADILKHRIRRDAGQDERQQISVAIGRIAPELGDRAEGKVSISRAMNLYQAADVHIAGFIDLLYRTRGEVLDRYRHPGNAPVPHNRMAYFFAVVEDRLGLRAAEESV
jgi:hypothetical protein